MTLKLVSLLFCRAPLLTAATLILTLIPATAAITQNQADYLNQMYADLLKRPVDSTSLARMRGMFNAGASRPQIATVITDGTEFRTLLVEGYYQTYFQRSASSSEVSLGVELLGKASGDSFQSVVLGTDEYFRRAGGTNDTFLQRLYSDVLNRAPTAAELRSGLDLLGVEQTRAVVATSLLASAERQRIMVAHFCQMLLRRAPSAAELNKLEAALASGAGEGFVIDLLAGSDEYLKFAVQAASHTITPCV